MAAQGRKQAFANGCFRPEAAIGVPLECIGEEGSEADWAESRLMGSPLVSDSHLTLK